MTLKGIILHGGRGTRLRPLTHTGPKQLIPIAGKPISQYVVEDMREAGISEIAVVLGNIGPERVQEHYGNGEKFGVKITYIKQAEPNGISQAIGLCKDFVGGSRFVVCLGDNLLKGGIRAYAKDFEKSQSDIMLLLTRVRDPEHFGVAEFDTIGRLTRVVEKPKYAPSPYIISGIYFFTPDLFDAIANIKPSKRGELEITDAIQYMLDKKCAVVYRIVDGWWKDTGTVEDILEANRLVLDDKLTEPTLKGKAEVGTTIEGRVFLERGAIVKQGAAIRGPCFVGSQTIVGAKCLIGPYTSIGNGCLLEEVEIENSIIMDNCQISRYPQRITDSVIGKFTQVKGKTARSGSARFILGEESQVIV